jgi:type III secretion protein Q
LPLLRAGALQAGDIVMPDQTEIDLTCRGVWRFGPVRCRVLWHPGQLEVLSMQSELGESADDLDNPGLDGLAEGDAPDPGRGAAAAFDPVASELDATAPLSDLPLVLEFSLGRLQCTLGDLAQLAPGAVLTLADCGANSSVAVHVGERELGRGELVDVQGRLGVRLTSWYGRRS